MKAKSPSIRSETGNEILTLKTIRKRTIPDEIIDQILSIILTGELKPGDRLPSERQLCESFNVGRNSVREALKSLENLGIIRRETTGTIVCPFEENRYEPLSLAATKATPEQILELMRIVGIEAAGLAAERATEEQKRRMAKALAEFENIRPGYTLHLSFHRALIDGAQNPLLAQMINIIIGSFFGSQWLASTVQGWEEAKLKSVIKNLSDGHKRILKAVDSRNATAAKKAMRAHLAYIESVILEEYREGTESKEAVRKAAYD